MNLEEKQRAAVDIILSHMEDLERLSVHEILAWKQPWMDMDHETFDKAADEVFEMIQKASLDITWEGEDG